MTGPVDGSVTEMFDPLFFSICVVGWSLSWAYCFRTSNGNVRAWDDSGAVSNAHSVPVCALAGLALAGVVSESVPLNFTLAYFVVDLVDAILRHDAPFTAHAILSLALNVGGVLLYDRHPLGRLKSLSKGYLIEASTPFLNRWKRTHQKGDYVAFFVIFTLCRIIWLPVFVYEMYAAVGKMDAICWASAAMYLLQFAWYFKLVSILMNYKVPDEVKMVNGEKEKKKL